MGSKQIKTTYFSLTDRISDLPNNIIECILDLLPIRDAVATSILSREWRHKWTRIPNLVFDNEFFYNVAGVRSRREVRMPFQYSNIIGKILLLQVGPIHKFVLHIPSFCNDLDLELVSWMHFISRKEVKELTIQAVSAQFKLPSYIFNCSELQSLKIVVPRLDLHPPQDFGGFCNLRCLGLFGVLDGNQISNLVSKCPLLERLSISRVADGDTLVIDAPRLLSLWCWCPLNTYLKLKNVRRVTSISLSLRFGTKKFCDLFDIFCSVPNVVIVTLSCLFAINAMPQDAPTSFPTTLHNHTSLTLLEIDISSPQCIYFVHCILKSSPNLQKLNLGILSSETIEDEAALHFLEMETRETQTLNSLLIIKMKGILGSKVEIMFIKLILSCSPILETMFLTGENIVKKAEFKLMSELLKCKRPSPQAQVMYLQYDDDSDNSIFNF